MLVFGLKARASRSHSNQRSTVAAPPANRPRQYRTGNSHQSFRSNNHERDSHRKLNSSITIPDSNDSAKSFARFLLLPAAMSFNGAIEEPYPEPKDAASSTVSHIRKGFRISARKLPISKSGPIDEMSESLRIPVPEMIFGDNMVSIEHLESGWRIEFNAYDALDRVDKTDKNMLKVAYSQEWSSSRFVELLD
jgi:hypothetical protein